MGWCELNKSSEYQIKLGEGVATFTRSLSSAATVAIILGDEIDVAGVRRLWLDRLVHLEGDTATDGWVLGGAVTTVLSRCEPASVGGNRAKDNRCRTATEQ